ncbi:unnamed protein product [Cylindrotheca closterium]|uniref:RING-type E3 ubiquitin transferase n=1 Tax=Cylindrotheca closterium TaxID=2856 RepID=A0AAD2G9S9_9STRA|nr:unnamed protein product [Cylindrotheca closterium]
MAPKKQRDAARKEKIAAKKKEAKEASAPIERDEKTKPSRDHWLVPMSYKDIPAVESLGIPSAGGLQPAHNIIELLVKERGAMIILENNTSDLYNKKLQEALDEAQTQATSGISRQFRKASIHVHPDRHGDLYWKEFDRLKSAYQIMKDVEVRKDYLDHMLHQVLIHQTDPRARTIHNFFQAMHDQWHEKYKKSQEQDTAHARYQQQQQQQSRNYNDLRNVGQQHYFIDTSERTRQPGHSSICKSSAVNRTIVLGLHIRNSEELLFSLHEVVIEAWPVEDEEDRNEVKRLNREDLKSILHEKEEDEGSHRFFRVPLEFDEHCKWCIQWTVILHIPELPEPYVSTASTRRLAFDLRHPAWKRSIHEYPILLNFAKIDATALSKFCQKLAAQEKMKPEALETESWKLHRLLSKGRSTGRRLHTCLEILEYSIDRCEPLVLLLKACDEGVHAKSILDQHVFAGQKKNALKSFKQSVATMIESGELSDWLDKVQMDQLKNHGGEANRLFQLLVEGKKANSLLVDSTALRKAADRLDLFSEKQCQTLLERAVQTDEQMAIETDRLVKEEHAKKKEETQRARLEARAKGMPLRGSEVELFGLQKRADLNGSVGLYMGIATTTEDRYIVKLFDGSEVSIKKTNFSLYERRNKVGIESMTTATSNTSSTAGPSGSSSTASPTRKNKTTKGAVLPKAPKPARAGKTSSNSVALKEEASTSSPNAISPPHRKHATWIPKDRFSAFIGPRGTNVRRLSLQTKVNYIKVMKEEVYMTSDGRKWLFVKIGGKIQNTLNAVKAINRWVEESESENTAQSIPDEARKGSITTPSNIKDDAPSQASAKKNGTQVKSSKKPKQNDIKGAKSPPRNATPSPTSTMEPMDEMTRYYSTTEGNNDPTTQNIKSSAGVRPIGPPSTTKIPHAVSPVLAPSALEVGQKSTFPGMLEFLTENVGCFKSSSKAFFDYLVSMDIKSMRDLAEATADNDLMADFIENGLKKFKKGSFKKAVVAIEPLKESISPMMMAASIPGLKEFLSQHAGSFKTSPKAFSDYLTSMDIEGMRDLAEAVEDDDVIADFIENGLKKFKKGSFKKAVLAIETLKASMIPNPNHPPVYDAATPDGLTCPISFQLMINDPVLAADGMTYERAVIEQWFERNQGSGCILSPMTGEPLPNLHLQPNIAVKTMAREHERSAQA